MDDFKKPIDEFLSQRSSMFSFLLAPESYLLGAGLLSSAVALLFLGLNALAIHCVVTSCAALDQESNTLSSWLIFEGFTGFFLLACIVSLAKYFQIRKERISGKYPTICLNVEPMWLLDGESQNSPNHKSKTATRKYHPKLDLK